jgi:hypothetical protein
MTMKEAFPFALALATACSSQAPVASPLVDLGSIPAEATLCQLLLHRATVEDAIALLGTPTTRNTNSDGTATVLFEFDAHLPPNPTIAILELQFASDHRFYDANVSNMDMPMCWHFDGDGGL